MATANFQTPIIVTDESFLTLNGNVLFKDVNSSEDYINHYMVQGGQGEEGRWYSPVEITLYLDSEDANVSIEAAEGAELIAPSITLGLWGTGDSVIDDGNEN
ncbi:MAG: hypothetical protein IJS66_05140 [Bacteroidales bacterium]|nr:hypothetical protein [Bacteroidales bacterium]